MKKKNNESSEDEDSPDQEFTRDELRLLQRAIDASPDCILITDIAALRILYVNRTAYEQTGYTRQEYMSLPPHSLTQLTAEEIDAVYVNAINAGSAGITLPPQLIADRSGTRRAWWEIRHRAFQFEGRWMLSTSSADVTQRVLTEQALQRAKRMYATLSASNEAIVASTTIEVLFQQICDAAVEQGAFLNAGILMVEEGTHNMRVMARAGATQPGEENLVISVDPSLPQGQGLVGAAYREARPSVSNDWMADPRSAHWREVAAASGIKAGGAIPILRGHSAIGVLLLYAAERRAFDKETVQLLQRIAQNITIALQKIEHDTERERTEERIRYLATHDSLTGIPNRMLFSELLNATLHSAARQQRRFALMFIDLDNFKQVNDTMGHAAGDQVLISVSWRLREILRASDILARMSGDEFVVLLQDVNSAAEAERVAMKMLTAVAEPGEINGQKYEISASIGICLYPSDGEDEKTLMVKADTAMYVAKDRGKNSVHFYSG